MLCVCASDKPMVDGNVRVDGLSVRSAGYCARSCPHFRLNESFALPKFSFAADAYFD